MKVWIVQYGNDNDVQGVFSSPELAQVLADGYNKTIERINKTHGTSYKPATIVEWGIDNDYAK